MTNRGSEGLPWGCAVEAEAYAKLGDAASARGGYVDEEGGLRGRCGLLLAEEAGQCAEGEKACVGMCLR